MPSCLNRQEVQPQRGIHEAERELLTMRRQTRPGRYVAKSCRHLPPKSIPHSLTLRALPRPQFVSFSAQFLLPLFSLFSQIGDIDNERLLLNGSVVFISVTLMNFGFWLCTMALR